MTGIEELEAIAARTSIETKLTVFPSGAAMLDLMIDEAWYCAEFLPSFKVYGLSKTANSSPFWEGFDESFSTAGELEKRINQLLEAQ